MKTKDINKLTLIKKLKAKALELGRSPTQRGMKNSYVYIKYFGSWNAALAAADLEISMKKPMHSKKDLIKTLLAWHKKHKRSPAAREFYNNPDTHSPRAYIRRFGSWNAGLTAAGLKITRIHVRYNKKDLITILESWYKKHKRPPTTIDFNKDTDTPHPRTYLKYFGSWNNALKEAGIKQQSGHIDLKGISKEDLLKIFKDEYLRIKPTSYKDFNNRRNKDKVPTVKRIIRHLNMGWSDLLVKINIPTADIIFINIPEERLFKKVRGIATKLKKPPSITEFDKYQDLTTSFSLTTRFGGWNKFLKSAGLLPKHKTPVNVPEDNKSLLKMYKEFSIKIGKEESGATGTDLDLSDEIYSMAVFTIRFGSMRNLRKLLNMKSRKCHARYSKENILNLLLEIYYKHGILTIAKLNSIDDLPSKSTILKYFKTTKMSSVWEEVRSVADKTKTETV